MTDPSPDRPAAPAPDPAYRAAPAHLPTDPAPPATPPADPDPVRRTRAGYAWIGIIAFSVMLVLLLIFILQNTQPVEISYFGADGSLPLAVAMLLAAVAGVLLTAIAGTLRIWQLRRHLRRTSRRP